MKTAFSNIRMFLWMTFLTGIIYPLLITGIAQLTMQQKANGDFITHNGKIIGATLIAQKFESDQYFWPRPSAVDYNPIPSGGSNLGPTSLALKKIVAERQEKILKTNLNDKNKIPAGLLFASGSGLDPHIDISTAYFQINRVAKARSLESGKIKNLIDGFIEKSKENYINVLILNKALDDLLAGGAVD